MFERNSDRGGSRRGASSSRPGSGRSGSSRGGFGGQKSFSNSRGGTSYSSRGSRAPFQSSSKSFGDRPAYRDGSRTSHGSSYGSSSRSSGHRPYSPRTSANVAPKPGAFVYDTSYANVHMLKEMKGGFRSKPSFGSSRSSSSRGGFSSGGRGGGSRGGFGGSRGGSRGGRRRGGFAAQTIDVSRYVNKNVSAPAPVVEYVADHHFTDFAIEPELKATITDRGYIMPTPIQDKTIPLTLKGKDVVGIANTGTGKTAAFLIPLINKALIGNNEQILIVAPTRELAQQIDEEFKAFSKGFGMYSVCCVGGAPIGRQIASLRHFNSFVIGTPGRIKDLVERRVLNLAPFKSVVLDEADRMLDMGFIADMRYFMSKMSKDRQTLFFSATLSPEIEKLISEFLNNPERISVKTHETSKNIEQDIVRIKPGESKVDVLISLLQKPDFNKVLVFGRTKHGVEKLSDMLVKSGIKSVSIHGNKSQGQRQRALDHFKKDHSQVLVATDVAARGLDISDVTHVINFDIPATHDDYVHRIGRTGRGNKKGVALTFVE